MIAVSGVGAAGQPNFQVASYPSKAMTYVQSHDLLGERLFTTDAWAGYTILRFWPQQRVFLDDRYDMYPKPLVDDYTDVADGHPNWEQVLDKYRVQVIVWQPKRALSQLLAESPHWRRVHTDHNAVVYVRATCAAGLVVVDVIRSYRRRRLGDVGAVLLRPAHERGERLEDRLAERRERVVDAGGTVACTVRETRPVALELAQREREHPL